MRWTDRRRNDVTSVQNRAKRIRNVDDNEEKSSRARNTSLTVKSRVKSSFLDDLHLLHGTTELQQDSRNAGQPDSMTDGMPDSRIADPEMSASAG